MEKFRERYKSYNNEQLFEILENTDQYQTEAIQAAQAEWNERSVSEKELHLLKEKFHHRKESHERETEARQQKVDSVLKWFTLPFEIFQTEKDEKKKSWTHLAFVGYFF